MMKPMPATCSAPTARRLSTMKATPARPMTRPDAFRHVIRSPRKAAAMTAVSTGLVLMMSADKPDETLCMPT
jgi:hypothetical protein